MASPLKTSRLTLRTWRDEDRETYAQMNADPAVMEFFPSLLSRQQSDEQADYIMRHFEEHGYGLWAVEENDSNEFMGFIGLNHVTMSTPFCPCVEIGWRLARKFWGMGYATEGGKKSLEFAFENLHLPEVVSFATKFNLRSIRVMEKLGMTYSPADDFEHPKVPEGHKYRPHVLYRVKSIP